MNQRQVNLLIATLVLIATSAIFPPRKYLPRQTGNSFSITIGTPSRGFLLSPQLNGDGSYYVGIDIGRMLAEWAIIAAFGGAGYLLVRDQKRPPGI